MMRDERIQKRIAELMEERNKRLRVSADYVLLRPVEIDQMDVIDILDDEGGLKPISQWPKVWRIVDQRSGYKPHQDGDEG